MKSRLGTAPPNGTSDTRRLAQWLTLAGALAVLGYASRIQSGKPDSQVLYRYSTAVGGLVQDAIVLLLVLAIAGFSRERLALRRPSSYRRAALYVLAALVAIYVLEPVYAHFTHPGNEQGLEPSRWEPAHAGAYVANAVVICTWVPLVEELTYRGLGFTLLSRYGRWPAILLVGLLFGLAHGLVVLLPVIVAFGCMLAWIRAETDSVFPGMVVHATFNLIALLAVVAAGG